MVTVLGYKVYSYRTGANGATRRWLQKNVYVVPGPVLLQSCTVLSNPLRVPVIAKGYGLIWPIYQVSMNLRKILNI